MMEQICSPKYLDEIAKPLGLEVIKNLRREEDSFWRLIQKIKKYF